MPSKKKVVLTFGTFDILHPGHISYLRQARALGSRLVVGIATDKNAEKERGRKPLFSQEQRREIVASLSFVDEAIVGFEDDKIKMVERVKPGIVALGYDQKPSDKELAAEFERRGIKAKIVRLAPYSPEEYKSSRIREKIAGAK
ncbi:FAD synthase [uncultured archaeon]|nr:FAD synthase [uncultured archaeon]